MITRVRKYIRDHQMLKAEDMVVAGISTISSAFSI